MLFPSNVIDWGFRSFVHRVMPVALQEGIAVQTMKPMGDSYLLESKVVMPQEFMQYALSQPASVVIHGMEKMAYLEETLELVKCFKPLTHEQVGALAEKANSGGDDGAVREIQDGIAFRFDGQDSAMAGVGRWERCLGAELA